MLRFFKLLLALTCIWGYAESLPTKIMRPMPDRFFTVIPKKIKNNIVTGNPNGSITIIDIYDYNCKYCKILAYNLDELVKTNAQIRWIHLPLGLLDGSLLEAKYAIAANLLGKFEILDKLMMKSPTTLTENQILDLAKQNGINVQRLKAMAHSEETANQLMDIYSISFGMSDSIPILIIGKSIAPSHGMLMVFVSKEDIIKQIEMLSKL
ncbi:MAG: DsbA oxidoreductase [Burkholderiales bacterium]|jgi:hypothetical protein|nr:DsbA oxidoreductase [Burkholderiales bacterium]